MRLVTWCWDIVLKLTGRTPRQLTYGRHAKPKPP